MDRRSIIEYLDNKQLVIELEKVDELLLAATPGFYKAKEITGKRLRALLVLTIAGNSEETIKLAAAVEAVHQASKLHDAISDESLNQLELNRHLLAGDALLAAAFGLAGKFYAELSSTVVKMAEGQALQLSGRYEPAVSSNIYQDVIAKKTAALFSFSCRSAAALSGRGVKEQLHFEKYGFLFGKAFQIADDILDNEFAAETQRRAALKTAYLYTAQAGKAISQISDYDKLGLLPEIYLSRAIGQTQNS